MEGHQLVLMEYDDTVPANAVNWTDEDMVKISLHRLKVAGKITSEVARSIVFDHSDENNVYLSMPVESDNWFADHDDTNTWLEYLLEKSVWWFVEDGWGDTPCN